MRITRDAMDRKDWIATHTRAHACTHLPHGREQENRKISCVCATCFLPALESPHVKTALLLCITIPTFLGGATYCWRAGCTLCVSLRVATADGKDGARRRFLSNFPIDRFTAGWTSKKNIRTMKTDSFSFFFFFFVSFYISREMAKLSDKPLESMT